MTVKRYDLLAFVRVEQHMYSCDVAIPADESNCSLEHAIPTQLHLHTYCMLSAGYPYLVLPV